MEYVHQRFTQLDTLPHNSYLQAIDTARKQEQYDSQLFHS
jgi:hypothetical protein